MRIKDWLMDQPQDEPLTEEEMEGIHEADIGMGLLQI